MNKKLLAIIAVILGIIFLIAAVIYFITPAKSLPLFLPGYDAGITKTHFKHGLGALILALAAFAFAWFQSGGQRNKNKTDTTPPATTQ